MGGTAAREIGKPDAGLLYALANAMSGGLLFASAERVCWASERLAEMAGFESPSDLEGLPLDDLFSDTGDGLPASTTRTPAEAASETPDGRTSTTATERGVELSFGVELLEVANCTVAR